VTGLKSTEVYNLLLQPRRGIMFEIIAYVINWCGAISVKGKAFLSATLLN